MAAKRCLAVLAAGSAAQLAIGQTVPCAQTGVGYNDPTLNATLNGGLTTSAAICQQTCSNSLFCEYFTWYSNSGGCWLQGINSTLTVVNENATAAPKACPSTSAANETENATIAAKGAIAGALNDSTGASFPWWGWVLIGLGVALVALLVLFCLCCGGKGEKKGKGRAAKMKKNRDVEEAAADSAPLMGTEMQLERQAAPVYTSVAAPIYTSVAAPMAMPAYQNYSMAAPMVSVAQPMYMNAQPMAASVSAAPAASCPNCGNIYAADSLFCRKCGQQREESPMV
jgi:hypothetical protein